jgi:hypothetical protein
LLWMKGRLLRLQILNERLNSFDRKLIADSQGHLPVVLDLFVMFDAFVAHRGAASRSGWWLNVRRLWTSVRPRARFIKLG